MKKYQKYLLTSVIVLIAIAAILFKYWEYVTDPWTRNGGTARFGPRSFR